MTTITLASATKIEFDSAAAPGLAMRTLAGLGRLFRAYHNRCATVAIDGFSDHQLADIGLKRDDLRDGLAEPFWSDPTHLMRDRAAARHRP